MINGMAAPTLLAGRRPLQQPCAERRISAFGAQIRAFLGKQLANALSRPGPEIARIGCDPRRYKGRCKRRSSHKPPASVRGDINVDAGCGDINKGTLDCAIVNVTFASTAVAAITLSKAAG